MKIREINTHF